MEAFGQVEDGAAGAALPSQKQGLLAVEGALHGGVVVGNDAGHRPVERPLDLGAAVMAAAGVAGEGDGDTLVGQPEGVGQVGQGALALAQFNPADRDNLELLLDSADEYSTKAREALGQNGANEEKGHA